MAITSGQQLVYGSTAARRILDVDSKKPCAVRVFSNSIWIHLQGQRPTFISKRKFKQHFIDWRKQKAQSLTVVQWAVEPHYFSVSNPAKGSIYQVECSAQALACGCEDYKNQMKFFGRGCCKHGYAVLAQLGFGSLSEYLTAQKVVPFPRAGEAPAVYVA